MNFNKKALNDKSLYMIHSKYRDNLHMYLYTPRMCFYNYYRSWLHKFLYIYKTLCNIKITTNYVFM